MTLADRIRRPGPKKILALDGGGILGLMSIEVLGRIEELLRERLGKGSGFVLADYFDFVAGTSTGAIIAALIAQGMPVQGIRRFYVESGAKMFERSRFHRRLHYKYEDEKLAAKLREVYGADTKLGSDKLRSLLMIVMRNATTDSPWPVTNNPFALFNQRALQDGTPSDECNLELPLWRLVRASTAAPAFFPPEEIKLGKLRFVFHDGGATPYNNPSFLAFTVATLEPYRVEWPASEENILLVSLGTGMAARANNKLKPSGMHLLYLSSVLPWGFIYGAQNQQDTLCRMFGNCRAGGKLDMEIGDLIGARGPVAPKLFTYLRYDADTSPSGLEALGLSDIDPKCVQQIDSTRHIPEIQRIGEAVSRSVLPEHFDGFA